jgi:uncharacterized protein
MTIADLRQKNLIIFECISGSRAYGTNIATSDTDIRGVFVQPQQSFYGLQRVEQVHDEKNDIIFYELRRFVELLAVNNPNILEMLAAPADCIVQKHPLFDLLQPQMFLSKLCRNTFAGYALSQIKKAHGLNKKIHNPQPVVRKALIEFCYVPEGQGSVPVSEWLRRRNWQQENCGLVELAHINDGYALFYDENNVLGLQGIIKKGEDSNDVTLSSVPKGVQPVAFMSFNKDGYSAHCRQWKEYWEWVEKRNEHRYENTLEHGKNYDSKNMMHTFRLLEMAEEILERGEINVRRPNRDWLLKIRKGDFDYAELMEKAEAKVVAIDAMYETSKLPKRPNAAAIERALVEIRTQFYEENA